VCFGINGIISWPTGINAESVAAEFLTACQRRAGTCRSDCATHRTAKGEPNFNPEGLLTRSHAEYVEGTSLIDMIKEDLVAERIAIDSYREMITYFGNDDPTSRRMLEGILASKRNTRTTLSPCLEKMG
jgi:bacterioferritin